MARKRLNPEVSRYLAKAVQLLNEIPGMSRSQIIDETERAKDIEDIREPVKSWAKQAVQLYDARTGATE
jgi:hypothetical protein